MDGPQPGKAQFGADEEQSGGHVPKSGHLENAAPAFLVDTLYLGVGFLERYGWFIVLGLVILVFLWIKLKPYWKELQNKWERQREIANFDPIKAASQQERMEEARRRWQEKQDAKAAKFIEDKMQSEEDKRREKIEDWDRHQEGKGYRTKRYKSPAESTDSKNSSKPKKPDKPLRKSDYSPLTGGGGGFSYRPSRRGAGGGGG
ncbi:hypothetical protein ACROYT_G029720 [Oculina patagonica]